MFGLGKKKEADLTEARVLEALRTVPEPDMGRDLVTLKMVREVQVQGNRVALTLVLTTPAYPHRARLEEACRAALLKAGAGSVTVTFTAEVVADPRVMEQLGIRVRNIIAVASGKGGVGKSTVSTNLAIALRQEGARVGLLDADIYGPNIPMMMGATHLPPPQPNRMIPTEAHGVRLMSIGFMVKDDQPIVWRGPMLHTALRQFLNEVDWGELDYLIIDMPPGTGDVQMSLAQNAPLAGGVIVTTPQNVALSDVRRGLATFQKLNVPVLGIIENMSYFIAPDTGKRYEIFGHGGGHRYADEVGVPFLGELPLDPRIAAGGDAGRPILIAEPNSPAAHAIRQVARTVAARVSVLNLSRKPEGTIGVMDIPILS